jgi:putative phosphoesterase
MAVAALYDVHGNLPALDSVLAELDSLDIERLIVGGDFAWGPQPREVLQRLRDLGEVVSFVRGNADREVAGRYGEEEGLDAELARSVAWCADQLSDEKLEWIAALPEQVVYDVEGLGEVLFCHGSPRSDEEIITAATPRERLAAALAGVSQHVVVVGHTHVQFDREIDGTRVINAGSVGMPYEGRPGAYWALLGEGIELRRTVYDFAEAASRLRRSGFPGIAELVRELYDQIPTAAEATEQFERRALDWEPPDRR